MTLPLDRFECAEQVGGIMTAVLDNGPARGSRVAFVNTGGGLRYTVALDRGADLVHAACNEHSLCYLSPNGLKPPSHAYHAGDDWLDGWPGGLLTTCGPVYFGHPRQEDGVKTNLHGHFSNSPAEVRSIVNPRPHAGEEELAIEAIIRDARVYGPNVETCRTIRSALGQNTIALSDMTVNRNNAVCPFGIMYHVNFGWPLLDRGARAVLSGDVQLWPDEMQTAPVPSDVNELKNVPAPSSRFRGVASRGCVVTPRADRDGLAHVGMINDKLGIAVELAYPVKQLPRITVWQHYAPGMYVTGIEPMVGTPFGRDAEPEHHQTLEPGELRETGLTIRVHATRKAIAAFAKHDGPLTRA